NQGHYRSDYLELKNQNYENQAKGTGARGMISPWKGVIRFGKREKLNPIYIEPFKVLEKVRAVAYQLELPQELSRVHYHEVKRLKQRCIPIIKVRWNSRRGPEFTWEREDQFRKKYPHQNYDLKMSNNSCAGKVINNEQIMDNTLNLVPTIINENGLENVIFDEELVIKGSKKWELFACGYFVGYKMSIQELRYHLYRMWSKYGLKHILNNGNGVFVFKFDNHQGLQTVIESGPWIVNNKPMVVQKGDPSVNLDRTEPSTLPLWIKLMNPPLEA
ncbi:zinc knuckle CX2CX4HX4C containing protein, partial [Tanacetum coccineum]